MGVDNRNNYQRWVCDTWRQTLSRFMPQNPLQLVVLAGHGAPDQIPHPTHLGAIKFCCLELRSTIVFIDFGLTILLSRLMCQDGPYPYCSHFMVADFGSATFGGGSQCQCVRTGGLSSLSSNNSPIAHCAHSTGPHESAVGSVSVIW